MMWPGEALLIKLWETLTEKGIGGLLKPWQIKREAKAQIESRQLETVAMADAEREADDIRSGRLSLADSRYAIALPSPKAKEKKEIELSSRPAVEVLVAAVVSDALRREVNVAKAITYAESELKDDPQKPSERKIDADWLYRWRDYAGNVSMKELQELWGRLLAGELKAPGAYSFRTLDFVRNLSADEAKKIERLSGFVINDFIARSQLDLMKEEGVSFHDLLELQNLGVISGVEALGLVRTFDFLKENQYSLVLCSHGRALIIKHNDPKKEIKIKAYLLTELGKEVLKLGKFKPIEKYLRAVGEGFKKEGFTVAIANYCNIDENTVDVSDEQPL